MASKGKRKQMNLAVVLVGVVAIILAGAVFNLSDNGVTGAATADAPAVQCNKDFTSTVSFVAKNEYQRSADVNNVTFKVWKIINGAKIPQSDSTGDLEIGYQETYEVVAEKTNATSIREEFSVDENCDGPEDKVFYIMSAPASVDSIFENPKVTGPITDSNKLQINQDTTKTVKATFTGQSKTGVDAIVVYDADKDIIDDIEADTSSVDTPDAHTTESNEKSYAFELGTFDGSSDLFQSVDITTDDTATLGNYNVSYTIYQVQAGYTDSDSGEWVNEPSVEDNDDALLLPTHTGIVGLEIVS